MKTVLLALSMAALACAPPSGPPGPVSARTATATTTATATATTTADSAPFDSGGSDSGTASECKLEGEQCTVSRTGLSNCCNSRHSCYPEGCYY
jgi:hypothetical protein